MKSTFLTIVVLVFDMTVSADEETRISKIEPRSVAKASTTMWSSLNSALPASVKRRTNGKRL